MVQAKEVNGLVGNPLVELRSARIRQVQRPLGKEKVPGSNPGVGSTSALQGAAPCVRFSQQVGNRVN